jgi:hypothetical protein
VFDKWRKYMYLYIFHCCNRGRGRNENQRKRGRREPINRYFVIPRKRSTSFANIYHKLKFDTFRQLLSCFFFHKQSRVFFQNFLFSYWYWYIKSFLQTVTDCYWYSLNKVRATSHKLVFGHKIQNHSA